MIKTALITLVFSSFAFAQIRPDMTSNPTEGFGTTTTPSAKNLPQNKNSSIQENRGNDFPQEQMEENNFAGGALGGATPGTTIPNTPGAVIPRLPLPESTSPGVAPTTPYLPRTRNTPGAASPRSTNPTNP